ncbi:odorant receptor 67c-like [Bactrocera tryoni]|uniref:odorant receptor 67c-like n=1 Tax=Bactrocera tryoni TaxID=59916 RepID=UPI001A98CD2C|nr:odorant receptor 67c-like [Bactrocera tryoni]XP_039966648.1 odorant receptor 67c-like [Bactrocera tryoni]XP_039966649.1 odorant receptor 67c-like [Bactrocera tryoni]XP_039966650.1 odorant receptor 67c-like [Bactrocera tryoni]
MTPIFKSSEFVPTVPDFVHIPFFLIKCLGVKLFKWTPDEPITKLQITLLALFTVFSIFNFTSMLLYVVYEDLETLLDITEFVLFWGFALNALMKGISMVCFRREIESILKGLIAKHPKTAEERATYQLVPYFRTINISNKYLSIWHLSITSIFVVHPLIASIHGYVSREDKNKSFDFTLPFMMTYFYDINQPLAYAVSYFLQCCGAFHVSLLFLSGDLLLISMVQLVNMHFGYLIYKIESFQPTGTDADMKVLGPLMVYHNEMLNYAERIDNTFGLATLLNYVGSCLVLCLICLQIAMGSEAVIVIKFIGFLVSTIVQVFFVSYFGNNLKDLSTGISDAFYNHPWYDANYKYMRMLVLPIARAQRYARLTAFKFFEISMDSFKSLCTTSYQFYTLLRTSIEEEDV